MILAKQLTFTFKKDNTVQKMHSSIASYFQCQMFFTQPIFCNRRKSIILKRHILSRPFAAVFGDPESSHVVISDFRLVIVLRPVFVASWPVLLILLPVLEESQRRTHVFGLKLKKSFVKVKS